MYIQEPDLYLELRVSPEGAQKVFVEGSACLRRNKQPERVGPVALTRQADGRWLAGIVFEQRARLKFQYHYFIELENGIYLHEEKTFREVEWHPDMEKNVTCLDNWADSALPGASLLKKPFTRVFFPRGDKVCSKAPAGYTHELRVHAVPLKPSEVVCLLGDFSNEHIWDTQSPLLMNFHNGKWSARIKLTDGGQYAYKYGIYDTEMRRFQYYEEGCNRFIPSASQNKTTIISDNFFRFPESSWRGAGVAVPVFSLRSEAGTGIGEFADLKLLIDWAAQAGFKLIQLLPVNDTNATGSWKDSYPYAAISAFALNPVYIRLEQVGKLPPDHEVQQEYVKQRESLALLPEVDYEKILRLKWAFLRALFDIHKTDFLADKAFKAFFEAQRQWLVPYAAFCYLRNKYGTADYSCFGKWSSYDEKTVEQLTVPEHPDYDEITIHYFVQYHLHQQFTEVSHYARRKGVVLKGDIPIGIYRHSVDAWMHPDQFYLHMQAGAPPDDFAVKGQNWGFPTYHWKAMEKDGFSWWQRRLQHLARYVDVIRYDHILGFFRIWQIPVEEVEGIMGHFQPDLPFSREELSGYGIDMDEERFCAPYITAELVEAFFGEDAALITDMFLDSAGADNYRLKPGFSTQRQIANYFRCQENEGKPLPGYLRLGLFDLVSNVIFFPSGKAGHFRPRFHFMKTRSFAALPQDIKDKLSRVHDHYFYQRHEAFWEKTAMRKLPALKQATDMLVCGEDLGMVPRKVPQVMHDLGMLSLEVQRMPKVWGNEFTLMDAVPYLSVVTPGTHDMSTIRGWWEEDREKIQRFYNEVLGHHGAAPYFCEPWIAREIIDMHFHSPAMWAIIQLQDLFGMSRELRHEHPQDERINIPSNPRHYWRYRMHLTLEQLLRSEKFNETTRQMIMDAGR